MVHRKNQIIFIKKETNRSRVKMLTRKKRLKKEVKEIVIILASLYVALNENELFVCEKKNPQLTNTKLLLLLPQKCAFIGVFLARSFM